MVSSLNRRQVVVTGLAAGGLTALALGGPRSAGAKSMTPVSEAQSAALTGYIAPFVALEKGYMKDEGLEFTYIVAGGGTKNRDMVAAGEVDFGLGDSTHFLQMTNRGRSAKGILSIDTLLVYMTIVIRKDIYDDGVNTLKKFIAWKRPDGSAPIWAVPTIGGGSHVYASYFVDKLNATKNVQWVAGGLTATMLGGLRTKQFDAIVATPAWRWDAEDNGWGATVFDVSNKASWDEVFGGSVPATSIYARSKTLNEEPEKVQAYVNANYRAVQWIKTASTDEIYDLVGPKYLGEIHADTVKKEINYYKKAFNYPGTYKKADYERGGEIWFREMTKIKPISFEDAVDNRFIVAANKKYG